MFQKNSISTDIGLHNIGIYKGKLVLFDYHGMHPILKNGRMPTKRWWGRLSKNLTRYMAYIYAPNQVEDYCQLMKNLNEKLIKRIEKDDLLPDCFIDLLKYFVNHPKNSRLYDIIKLLDHCISCLKYSRRNRH